MAWTCPTVKRSPFPRLQAFRSLLHRFKAYLSGQERSWQHMYTPMVQKIFFCYCCYYYIWDLLVGSQADEALHFVALSNFVLDPLALVPSHPGSTPSTPGGGVYCAIRMHKRFALKGWLAIAKLKPLSLFISLLSIMPMKAFDNVKVEKWKVKVVSALQ